MGVSGHPFLRDLVGRSALATDGGGGARVQGYRVIATVPPQTDGAASCRGYVRRGLPRVSWTSASASWWLISEAVVSMPTMLLPFACSAIRPARGAPVQTTFVSMFRANLMAP